MADDREGPGLGVMLIVGLLALFLAWQIVRWVLGVVFALITLVAVTVVAGAIVVSLVNRRADR